MKLFKTFLLIISLLISLAGCKHIETSEPVAAVVGKVVKMDKKPLAPWTYRKMQKDKYGEKL